MSETRVLYRLERRCQSCHDGHVKPCERTVYASPAAPRVRCECECRADAGDPGCTCVHVPVRTHVNPDLITIDDPAHPRHSSHSPHNYLACLSPESRALMGRAGAEARWGKRAERQGGDAA